MSSDASSQRAAEAEARRQKILARQHDRMSKITGFPAADSGPAPASNATAAATPAAPQAVPPAAPAPASSASSEPEITPAVSSVPLPPRAAAPPSVTQAGASAATAMAAPTPLPQQPAPATPSRRPNLVADAGAADDDDYVPSVVPGAAFGGPAVRGSTLLSSSSSSLSSRAVQWPQLLDAAVLRSRPLRVLTSLAFAYALLTGLLVSPEAPAGRLPLAPIFMLAACEVCLLASTGLLFKLFGLPSDSSGQAAHDKLGVPASALSKLLSLVPGLSEVLGAASAVRGAAADLVSDALTFVVAYVLLEYARESGLLPPQLLALVGDGGAAGTASRQFDEQ